MPPKTKFSKEEIINSAFEITKEKGFEGVTAREVGKRLNVSSCPIYTAFENISELKNEVVKRALAEFDIYRNNEVKNSEFPVYKAEGISYIRFAKNEKNLFKLLFMRDRTKENFSPESQEHFSDVIQTVKKQTGYEEKAANFFHFEMWIFVHGIATMMATSYVDIDFETISKMMTDVYNGLMEKGKSNGKYY